MLYPYVLIILYTYVWFDIYMTFVSPGIPPLHPSFFGEIFMFRSQETRPCRSRRDAGSGGSSRFAAQAPAGQQGRRVPFLKKKWEYDVLLYYYIRILYYYIRIFYIIL
jgi:hypothetical protein